MSYFFENRQKSDEILFANRNKAYGAYVIRSSYGNTLMRAITIMSTSMALILFIAWYAVNREEIVNHVEQLVPLYKSTPIDLKPEVLEKAKPKTTPQPKTSGGSNPNRNSMATQISDTAAVESNTVMNANIGVGTSSAVSTQSTDTGGGSAGSGSLTGSGGEENTILVAADSDPEFEGGTKALLQYLARNLVYPAEARELGKGGKITVRFVVDETGKVTTPEVLNKLGFGMDAEAIRVVKSIPNFKKPAMFKGKPAKVYFNLPINFSLK